MIQTEEMTDLYRENYETLKKKTEEDTDKWKLSCVPRFGELMLKQPYYPN